MSFNRSGYIGRAPGDSSIVLAKQYFQPTGAGRTFTFTSGYDPGLIDVYRNGVKLINALDYAATDGSTVVLDTPVGVGSTVQVVAYKGFNVTEVNSSAGDFTVGSNLYVQSGFGSFAQGIIANQINVSGIGTIGIGSFTDINVSGGATVSGTLVANSFSGDGSALTGLANTDYIVSVATTTGDLKVGSAVTVGGIVNIDATTDSTSSTTGALIVDGGLGVAKNVYIGAGLSVAGTLTYEDVTNVDSVGMVTAKSGLNVSGGEVTVGSAVTIGSAGVTTFIGAAGVGVTITPSTGKVEATTFYGDGSNLSNITTTTINSNADNRLISGSGTANTLNGESNLTFDGSTLTVTGAQTVTGDLFFDNGDDAGKDLKWDSSVGALTFEDEVLARFGSGADLTIRHVSNNSYIENNAQAVAVGNLYIRSFYQENGLVLIPNGAVEAYYDNSKKIETTNDGTVTTGIATATGGHITGGGELKVGTGVTISSTAGVSTFSKAVTFNKADVTFTGDNYDILFDASSNCIRWADDAQAQWGTGQDLRQYHDGSHGNINVLTGDLLFKWNSQETFRIGDTGVKVTGIATVTEGLNTDGILSEKFETTAGKLSNNTNIDLADGMVHYFTTAESTTCTPNIRYSSSKSLNNMLSTGDAITVTIITTANAGGYSANFNIDGSGITEEWVGGSAPTAGGDDGHDIYTLNILKTGSSTYKVIINVVNAT